MVIQKVHGIHATGVSLHERFSMLAQAAPDRVAMRQRRRSLVNQNLNYGDRLLEQVARQLQQQQARKQALRQRLGLPQPGLRRFGSEGSLAGLKRSNSFGNLSQQSVKNRVAWRQSNFNLSRSSSFNNFNNLAWYGRALRGFRKRGSALRGRFRAGRQGVGRMSQQRVGFQQRRGAARRGLQQQQRRAPATPAQQHAQPRPQLARRGAGRGRGRGGLSRSQSQSRLLSKEELDAQLDQYMSCTKAALDQQLDNYMKSAMELE
ncbi:chromatin target of PRMT1 protein-like [Trichoplusia ni]|uniref:Chromatin target of PRMT1 protein-like n=1 Tax=Trichoplusia ni TaxID=7111 RepID=A0A7E5WEB1_TRINI|nr:chromatin target of PRMT1 protein-like [Trichoplusia ni]XP_026739021.1 chromatin target of PRMT1 protein-like [Trichoplusia ni]